MIFNKNIIIICYNGYSKYWEAYEKGSSKSLVFSSGIAF